MTAWLHNVLELMPALASRTPSMVPINADGVLFITLNSPSFVFGRFLWTGCPSVMHAFSATVRIIGVWAMHPAFAKQITTASINNSLLQSCV